MLASVAVLVFVMYSKSFYKTISWQLTSSSVLDLTQQLVTTSTTRMTCKCLPKSDVESLEEVIRGHDILQQHLHHHQVQLDTDSHHLHILAVKSGILT